MSFCARCGKEVSEYASICRNCGTRLAQLETLPPVSKKRHPTTTASAILLFVCAAIDFIHVVNHTAIDETPVILVVIVALLAGSFAVAAGVWLWKSDAIGGVCGIAYALLSGSPILFPGAEYPVVIPIVFLYTPIIVLIVIGWRHLKHP